MQNALLAICTGGSFLLAVWVGSWGILWLEIPWLAFMAAMWWYYFLRIPLEIRTKDGIAFEFRGFMWHETLRANDITAIKESFDPGFLKLHHRGGTLTLVAPMTGRNEFISAVKAANPTVEISAC